MLFFVRIPSRNCFCTILKVWLICIIQTFPILTPYIAVIEIYNISVWITWMSYKCYTKLLYLCPSTFRLKVSGDCHYMVRWFNYFQTTSCSLIGDAYVSCLLELSHEISHGICGPIDDNYEGRKCNLYREAHWVERNVDCYVNFRKSESPDRELHVIGRQIYQIPWYSWNKVVFSHEIG